MEHRNGSRTATCIKVFLHQGGKCLGCFETRDLSFGGLSLKGNAKKLTNNSLVDVSIEQRRDIQLGSTVLKALVVHQQLNCIGLMWAGINPVLSDTSQKS